MENESFSSKKVVEEIMNLEEIDKERLIQELGIEKLGENLDNQQGKSGISEDVIEKCENERAKFNRFLEHLGEKLGGRKTTETSRTVNAVNAKRFKSSIETCLKMKEKLEKPTTLTEELDYKKECAFIDTAIMLNLEQLHDADKEMFKETAKNIFPQLSEQCSTKIIQYLYEDTKVTFAEMIEKTKQEILEKTGKISSQIKDFAKEKLDELGNHFQELLDNAKNEAKARIESGKENVADIFNSALQRIEAITAKLQENINSIKNSITYMTTRMNDKVKETGKAVSEIIQKCKDEIRDTVDKAGAYAHDIHKYNQELGDLKNERTDKEKLIKTFEKALNETSAKSDREKLEKVLDSLETERDEINEKIKAVSEKKEQVWTAFFKGETSLQKEGQVAEAASKPSFFQKVRTVAQKIFKPHKEPVGKSDSNILKQENPPVQAVDNIKDSEIKDDIANLTMKAYNAIVIEAPNVNIKPFKIVMSPNKDWNEYNPHEKNNEGITQTENQNISTKRITQTKNSKQVSMEM